MRFMLNILGKLLVVYKSSKTLLTRDWKIGEVCQE